MTNQSEKISLLPYSQEEFKSTIKDCIREVLSELPDLKNNRPDSQSDIIDINEACKITNYTRSTIYTKACRGEIPSIKQGKFLKFSRKDLIAWIESGKRKTADEIDDLANDYILNSKKR